MRHAPLLRPLPPIAGLLALTACATAPEASRPLPCPPSDNWQAWIDVLGPRAPLGLFVDGEVTLPPRTAARLRPGPLDKSMPPSQRFVLELSPSRQGRAGPQRVRGVARPALPRYRSVIVTCGGREMARIDGEAIETAD